MSVRGEKFFDRKDILRWVEHELNNPDTSTLLLFGQRRIGKTSILLHLERALQADAFLPVYFDLQDQATRPLGQVLADLADEIALRADLELPEAEAFDDRGRFFRRVFLPRLHEALDADCRPVFLFDEFDVLDQKAREELPQTAATKALLPLLRRVMAQDQHPALVFATGRRAEDLSQGSLAMFKTSLVRKVGMMDRRPAERLVRQAEENNTLFFSSQAVERILDLTGRHPYFTQLLCQRVWEYAYTENPKPDAPLWIRDPGQVEAAVPDALEKGGQALAWLWDGLPPAERVVTSALAVAGPGPISQGELERVLKEAGVRVIIPELQEAPGLLQKWDLIEPAGGGYCFRVELLRRWIARRKPLRSVQKEELAHIEPVSEKLYQAAAFRFRQGNQLDLAADLARQAVGLNPNHIKANQLLADVLLAQGEIDEARALLERLYQDQPDAARSRLVRALLANARAVDSEDRQLALYERVLQLNPERTEAIVGRQRIWEEQGDAALHAGDLPAALEAFERAGLPDRVAEVRRIMRRRWARKYRHAEKAAQRGDREEARTLLVELGPHLAPISLENGSRVKPFPLYWRRRGVGEIACAPDGTWLAATSLGGIYLYDMQALAEMSLIEVRRAVHSLAFSPDGGTLAAGLGNGAVQLWRVADLSGDPSTLKGHKSAVYSVAFSPNGEILASGSWDGTVLLRQVASGSTRHTLEHESSVYSVAFSPDGGLLVSGSGEGEAHMWQVSDGKRLETMQTSRSNVLSVAFSADGGALALGSADGTVLLWRMRGDAVRPRIPSGVNSLAFSPDGSLLAAGSQDGRVWMWRVGTGRRLNVLEERTGSVESVAFSPDGRFLVSASSDGTVRLWGVPPD